MAPSKPLKPDDFPVHVEQKNIVRNDDAFGAFFDLWQQSICFRPRGFSESQNPQLPPSPDRVYHHARSFDGAKIVRSNT